MPKHADAAGCVAYRYDENGQPLVLLIHDQYGVWTLPKGHLDAGETEAQAAIREVYEETGISGELGAPIGTITYTIRKKGAPYLKRVTFFLLHAHTTAAVPQAAEGISAAEWLAAADAPRRVGYDTMRDILERATAMIPPRM